MWPVWEDLLAFWSCNLLHDGMTGWTQLFRAMAWIGWWLSLCLAVAFRPGERFAAVCSRIVGCFVGCAGCAGVRVFLETVVCIQACNGVPRQQLSELLALFDWVGGHHLGVAMHISTTGLPWGLRWHQFWQRHMLNCILLYPLGLDSDHGYWLVTGCA